MPLIDQIQEWRQQIQEIEDKIEGGRALIISGEESLIGDHYIGRIEHHLVIRPINAPQKMRDVTPDDVPLVQKRRDYGDD